MNGSIFAHLLKFRRGRRFLFFLTKKIFCYLTLEGNFNNSQIQRLMRAMIAFDVKIQINQDHIPSDH